jgi:hypothetical protein
MNLMLSENNSPQKPGGIQTASQQAFLSDQNNGTKLTSMNNLGFSHSGGIVDTGYSLLDINREENKFWSKKFDELLEIDVNFLESGLFTKNRQSISKLRFFAITQGSALVYKKVRTI